MKRFSQVGMLLASASMLLLAGCGAKQPETILHLGFDEGAGTKIVDVAHQEREAEVQYRYTNPMYTESMDPQWREIGIQGGSLLFDGNSTCISYEPEDVRLEGKALTVDVWVAPRAFEWDDPNAKNMGTQEISAILGQYNKSQKQGVLLGYGRYGEPCLEIGAEDGWHTIWGSKNFQKDVWNHVVFTYDAEKGSITFYLNGEVIGTDSIKDQAAIVPAEREKLLIGKNVNATSIAAGTYHMFSGLMDELNIYAEVLPEEKCLEYAEVPEIAYEDIGLEDILSSDVFKTQYHGGPYQHWMNEPHAPIYYNGMYHLFFQQNMVGTYWRNIQWGHLVSEDMVNWRPVKEAICATEDTVVPDGVWSGNATYDANGVPLLFFTAGNDSFKKDQLLSNQNIGIAYPKDLSDPELIEWNIYDELAVAQGAMQGRAGEFRDPYLWKEGDTWCMLICSGSSTTAGGSALLYISDKLELLEDGNIDMDWQYRGPVYEMENQSVTYGTSWELPILMPLTNEAGTITKYMFMISPAPAGTADNKAYYFIGDFDLESGKFTPDKEYDNQPKMLDYGDNVFTGPSAMVDPVSQKNCVFSIMQDKRNGAEEGVAGWAHSVGLTREIWLNDDGSDLCVRPLNTLETLEQETLVDSQEVQSIADANALLQSVEGDMLHVKVTFEAEEEASFGIQVKSDGAKAETKYWYEKGQIHGGTSNRGSAAAAASRDSSGAITLSDGELSMDIYIDRSLVEGFFNEQKALSIRSYSDYAAQKICVFGDDSVKVKQIYIATMGTI